MPTSNDLRLSHTSLSDFRYCPTKFLYRHVGKLVPKEDKWEMTKDFGSAIHYAIEQVLHYIAEQEIPRVNWATSTIDTNTQVAIAIEAVRSWVIANTDPYRTITDEMGNEVRHTEYYDGMEQIYNEAPHLVEFLLPHLQLGTRYFPAMLSDFFDPINPDSEVPMYHFGNIVPSKDTMGSYDSPIIEFNFEITDDTGHTIVGIIDAVLYDRENDAYVLFDWKVRSRILDEVEASMDSQLMLYATIFNQLMDVNMPLSSVCMMQMRNTLPKPAKMNKPSAKGWLPSISPQVSTWDVWWNSIPDDARAKLDEREWQEKMLGEGRLKTVDYWFAPVTIPVTPISMREVDLNTELTLQQIDTALRTDRWLKLWSAHSCGFCVYKDLCKADRFHGDAGADTLANLKYDKLG